MDILILFVSPHKIWIALCFIRFYAENDLYFSNKIEQKRSGQERETQITSVPWNLCYSIHLKIFHVSKLQKLFHYHAKQNFFMMQYWWKESINRYTMDKDKIRFYINNLVTVKNKSQPVSSRLFLICSYSSLCSLYAEDGRHVKFLNLTGRTVILSARSWKPSGKVKWWSRWFWVGIYIYAIGTYILFKRV